MFGIKVKKRLIDLNMTQRELSSEIGVNENYLTDILNGRRSGKKYKNLIVERLDIDIESGSEDSF
ncbi:MAG: helix-turn-helix domain-containing protein [Clostridium sp.]|jgi:transcriptional regulator with XRE-family HTH domain|uniref:helix-turn-helix domain-containing protein n=1 Tax=Clostridium sp. TaxID=1506 RepID=UPI0025BF3003|nr:helix-turn-helix transcriptional regulator [Clostridium sp.]MCH3964365.1 helix-turn-helix domain-containing protein [Clostridium sp.]MCI1715540.1 helix-turn-helix domain-containing protein [Clostridium sp.]MCI1799668.1 helix-turn-helix domain-containing protein [Clostridium sp.]MCI1813724.1 helix-turn-helix domain-containing protein [Clostridium sp.]MCI1870481.1 helix-turn-helix domain-containing protein [Clostridium sp.]